MTMEGRNTHACMHDGCGVGTLKNPDHRHPLESPGVLEKAPCMSKAPGVERCSKDMITSAWGY